MEKMLNGLSLLPMSSTWIKPWPGAPDPVANRHPITNWDREQDSRPWFY